MAIIKIYEYKYIFNVLIPLCRNNKTNHRNSSHQKINNMKNSRLSMFKTFSQFFLQIFISILIRKKY